MSGRGEIRAPDYEDIGSPAELTSADDDLESLTILGFNDDTEPEIGFEFLSGKVKVWTSEDRPDLRGALDDIVRGRPAPDPWWNIIAFTVAMMSVVFGPTILLADAFKPRQWLGVLLGIAISVAIVPRLSKAFEFLTTRKYRKIHNAYRELHPSFWDRNRDAILRDLLVGVVVAAVTIALTLAFAGD